ncbi:hypothetical protein F2Q68_00003039 [Brassica cretica]|uniref:Uncharacterized protein n=1 Tax=Brassica cretica TaxID=69181 RepID=A0A8S9JPZ2_BRACR|nr:hypothetical protein F2Q68_00003039 [Brassica cretica]
MGGFLIGGTCSAPCPPLHSRLLPSPPPSQFLLLSSTNAANSKRRRPPSASLRRQDVKRRAFVLVGISVLPFFQLQSPALADERDDNEIKTSKLNQDSEVAVSEGTTSSPNTFLSLLNGLGIFSSGVLGALYALARKDTKAAEETIESLKNQLKERERALVLMEKDFEARILLTQEEWNKERKKAEEERFSLINQLNSAKEVATGLGKELSSEKKLSEELRAQMGGFLIGSTCSSPSPPLHSSRFLPSPSSSSQFLPLCSTNAANSKRRRPPSASLRRHDAVSFKRRAFVLVGISVLPFFQLQSPALADERDGDEVKTSKLNQESEVAVSEGTTSSPNTFLSLLNGLGIFSSGVLGALYALARKDTKAAEETIESLKNQLKDRERALVLMEKDFEARILLTQEEWNKERKKAEEERFSLINQLNSAKEVATGLGKELSSEKKLSEELRAQVSAIGKVYWRFNGKNQETMDS